MHGAAKDVVADSEARDRVAHRHDPTRELGPRDAVLGLEETEHQATGQPRERRKIRRAHPTVTLRHRARMNTDQDLALPNGRGLGLAELEDVRATIDVLDCRFHGMSPSDVRALGGCWVLIRSTGSMWSIRCRLNID